MNMTEHNIIVALGTAATMLAVMLISFRISARISRALTSFSAWWLAASLSTSALVVIGLAGIAVSSFASIGAFEPGKRVRDVAAPGGGARDAEGLEPLRAYASKIDGERKPVETPAASKPAELSDVDTMIAKLAARLEKEPEDVKGWKMLGWSYLNMDRPDDAIKAYEAALKLEPSDPAIVKALEQAKSARKGGVQSLPSASETAPTSSAASSSDDSQTAAVHASMIRGMVDQLAARLEVTPADEAGWLQLIRSRVTLDERDAAKTALAKALAALESDPAAKARLVAVAAELGVSRD